MSGDQKVRVGSRKSELALIQTRHVISLLSNLYPEKIFEIVTMSTLGDKILDIPLPKIGEKSLFTKELETALATGCVDFVVHSLKDLPTALPDGMAIGAVLEREDPRDAIVMRKDLQSSDLSTLPPKSLIGTSSLRRTAQLSRTHPHLKVESIRGNLNTRIRKLDESDKYSAIILAQAGLSRMGWQSRISKVLMCAEMMYAVGQGALAVECRTNDLETLKLLQPLHCAETVLRILAERSFLKTLGGGCSAPVAVSTKLTPFEDKLSLSLTGGVWNLDGKTELKDSEKCLVEVKSLDSEKKLIKETITEVIENKTKSGEVKSVEIKQCPYEGKLKKEKETDSKINQCPYNSPICKKPKLDDNVIDENDPHKHCPVFLPVGLDFMGKCPYLDAHEAGDGKCPVNAEIQTLTGEHSIQKVTKCPYFKDGHITVLPTNDVENETESNNKIVNSTKLYCGIVPSDRTPLWALEQAEHLGINLAEKLLKNGALEVMQTAQAQIRGTV